MSDDANANQPVWLIRAGRRGRYASDFHSSGVTAIGWPDVGDLATLDRPSAVAAVQAHYGAKGAAGTGGMLYRFAHEIAVGDWVLMPDTETREIYAGRVTGEYEHRSSNPPVEAYPHVRTVEWSQKFSRDELPKRILYQLGSLLTVSQPSGQEDLRAFLEGTPAPASTNDDTIEGGSGDDDATGAVELYEELRSQTGELIRAKIAALDAYETQDLVAGILRSMGYFTQVAPEGRDGGVDIVATKDALGVEQPTIKVQVKARPNSRSGPQEVRELAGLVSAEERGVFVSTGGYTTDAKNDGQRTRITLIGMDRLVELLLDNYERLDQDTKSLIPLRRVYVP